jgi:hypothetical protein
MNHEERSLKEIYLTLSERYRYQKFELLPAGQGALLKEGEARSCEIYRDRLVIREQPTQVSTGEYFDQVVPIADEIQRRLKIPIWVVQQAVLRFLVPFEEPVIPLLQSHLFNIGDDALEEFGRPVLGMCLRIEFPPLPEDPSQMQLRVEPYFRNPKRLYIELSARFLQPAQSMEDLRARLATADEFVKEKALSFLESILSKNQG